MTFNNEATPTLLDRVTYGLTPAQKSRVLDLVVRLDLDPSDPIFLIALSIGHLQILVEDAPDEWQQLFKDHQTELNRWATTNIQTLELVAEKGKLMEALTISSKRLADTSQHLATACNGLAERLHSSENNFQALSTMLNSSTSPLHKTLRTSLDTQLRQQTAAVVRHLKLLIDSSDRAGFAGSWTVVLAGLALIGVMFLGWQQHRIQQQLATLDQRSEWQLSNTLRMACTFGVKSADSPECQ